LQISIDRSSDFSLQRIPGQMIVHLSPVGWR
jgi:hypothetical protein